MSRSGYADADDNGSFAMWRGQVASAIRGKRGQAFLREMLAAMDAMPEKVLIASELINADGDCCAIGTVCKARGIDVSSVDVEDPAEVAATVGIARQMAAEIEYVNDEMWGRREKPSDRWVRVRKWIVKQIKEQTT